MQFRTLGPLEVDGPDGPVPIVGAIRVRLLCRLLVASSDRVATSALIRAGWGDSPPRSAARTLQSHLSRLRAAGVPVLREGDGYRTNVPVDDVDGLRFQHWFAGQGLMERSAEEMREALAWWRGPAWVDLEPTAPVREQHALADLKRSVEERLVHGELAAHRFDAAAAWAEQLTEADPRRELAWAMHAVALAGGQRRADALDALHRASLALRACGLDVGPVLHDVENAVLGDQDIFMLLGRLETVLGAPPRSDRTVSALGAVVAHELGTGQRVFGREQDVSAIEDALDRHRLVTIKGAGGIGKSTVAEVVFDRRRRLGRHAAFVRLAVPRDVSGAIAAIAERIGIDGAVVDARELVDVLRRRNELLLVIDNAELITSPLASLVSGLVEETSVTILVASRSPVGARGEHVVPLGPIDRSAAQQQFTRVLRDAGIDIAEAGIDVADPEMMSAIADICQRVDCVPLAVELAAKRAASLGVQVVRDRLERLLTARTPPGVPDLGQTIRWSASMLDEPLQRIFERTSVFAGSFDLEAFEALAVPAGSGTDALMAIECLARHSLVETLPTAGGCMRYRMLEPVREAAAAGLGDRAELCSVHARYFIDRIQRAYGLIATCGDAPLSDLVEQDLDNLGAAHRTAVDSGRLDLAARLLRPLLAYVHWHEVFRPSSWAAELIRCEPPDLLTLAIAISARAEGTISDAFESSQIPPDDVYEAATAAPEGSEERRFLTFLAAWSDSVGGDRRRAVDTWASLDDDDPYIRFMKYFIGTYPLALTSADPASAAREHLVAGHAWAEEIGARNFSAGLRLVEAEFEALFGDAAAGRDMCVNAFNMASERRMRWVGHQAVLYETAALLRLGEERVVIEGRLRDSLQSAVAASSGMRVRSALSLAAPVLARGGARALAAEASLFPDIYEYPIPMEIPPRERDSARTRLIETGDGGFDVALRVVGWIDARVPGA